MKWSFTPRRYILRWLAVECGGVGCRSELGVAEWERSVQGVGIGSQARLNALVGHGGRGSDGACPVGPRVEAVARHLPPCSRGGKRVLVSILSVANCMAYGLPSREKPEDRELRPEDLGTCTKTTEFASSHSWPGTEW